MLKGGHYKLVLAQGEDVLSSIDKLFKKSKLEIRFIKDVFVACQQGDSTLCRTAHSIAQSFKFKIKGF